MRIVYDYNAIFYFIVFKITDDIILQSWRGYEQIVGGFFQFHSANELQIFWILRNIVTKSYL